MSLPKSHFAVLMNCVPIAFVGVLSSTTVSSIRICCPAGMIGKSSKVSRPPTFENVCGAGAPLLSQ